MLEIKKARSFLLKEVRDIENRLYNPLLNDSKRRLLVNSLNRKYRLIRYYDSKIENNNRKQLKER